MISSILKQPVSQEKQKLWIRALFVVVFFVHAAATIWNVLALEMGIPHVLFVLVKNISIPSLFFAVGLIIGQDYGNWENFRKVMYKGAIVCLLVFYGIGSLEEIFIKRRAALATFKDLLAIIRIPAIVSMFLSFFFLFLILGFFVPRFHKILRNTKIYYLLGIVGILFVFIPDGLIGYGLIGVFTGSDNFGAAPIFYYLFPLFAGIGIAKGIIRNLLDKRVILVVFATGVLACASYVLKQELAMIVLALMVISYVLVVMSYFLLPVYVVLEKAGIQFGKACKTLALHFNEKCKKSRRWSLLFYYIGYTLLFILVARFVFSPFVEADKGLIWNVDGITQYVPKAYRFLSFIPDAISSLLKGNFDFMQYDFSTGLGQTVSISYDPIYWLYLLFGKKHLEFAYSLMVLLRYYLAGVSISAMLIYFKKSYYASYLVSMTYVFCGYVIFAGIKHGQFITPLILLPILVIAMEELISKGKWYLLTIFTAISLLCSYYFLYMNTIALGIYFVTRILCTKEYRTIKNFFLKGFTIVGAYVLGTSMGIISLFTSFGSYLGSGRAGGSGISNFITGSILYYRPQWLSDTFVSFISDTFTPGAWLKLGFVPLAFLAIVLLFTRCRKKELRPMFLILTSFFIFPIFGYILSGFGSVTNRWCYIYALLISFILAEFIESFDSLRAYELRGMFVLILVYGGIICFSTKYKNEGVFVPYAFLTITFILILLINYDKGTFFKKHAKSLLFIITIVAVVVNANVFLTEVFDNGQLRMDTYITNGEMMKYLSHTPAAIVNKVEDAEDGFFRTTNLNTNGFQRDASMVYGYNDISTFTSTLNGGIVNYNKEMGNVDWNMVSIYSYNARTILNELASVKYIAKSSSASKYNTLPYGYKKVYEENKSKQTTYELYENQYALPIAYTYSQTATSSQVENLSAAEKQNLTLDTAILDDEDATSYSNLGQSDLSTDSLTKLEVKDMKLSEGVSITNNQIIIEQPEAEVTFYFDGEENAETYLSIHGDIFHEKDATEYFISTFVKAKDVNYSNKFRIDSYATHQDEYLYNLGYHEQKITRCTLKFESVGTINFDDISVYSQKMDDYPDKIAALKESSLENVEVSDNTVKGTISADEDKILVITLPYQSGWKAYVDGKETELTRANYQYMALNLKAGEHTVELHYQLPGLKLSFVITIAGLLVFMGIVILRKLLKR